MQFASIVGNEKVKKELRDLVEKKTLPNSFLFLGPDGIGKKLFAKEFAISLMYPKGASEDLCQRIREEKHPDLHLFVPEGKTGMHAITSIRKLMEDLALAPFEAEAKIFILEDAERMLSSSANALLKTLEEPCLDSYLILLSSKLDDLLPTIISRCAKIRFSPLSEEEIKTLIETKWKKTALPSPYVTALAQGSAAQAYALIHHPLQKERRELLFFILSQQSSFGKLSDSLEKMEQLYSKEEENSLVWHKDVSMLLAQILMWYRDLYLLKMGGDHQHLYFLDKLDLLQQRALSSLPSVGKIHEILEKARLGIERNMKLKMVLEYLFLELGIA